MQDAANKENISAKRIFIEFFIVYGFFERFRMNDSRRLISAHNHSLKPKPNYEVMNLSDISIAYTTINVK